MAEGMEELGQSITHGADLLNSALEDGDIDEAKSQISKIRGRLDEMDRAIAELPETEDMGD